jgi:hypothetical protein
MMRSFFNGLAAFLGWRVGEAVVREAGREIRRFGRARTASAQTAFEEALAEHARACPGGTPETAFVVVSSSQIDPHAEGLDCVVCDGTMLVVQHRAATFEGVSVRVLDLACRRCGSPRVVYFRIERPN